MKKNGFTWSYMLYLYLPILINKIYHSTYIDKQQNNIKNMKL
jgi:hypothetical protein